MFNSFFPDITEVKPSGVTVETEDGAKDYIVSYDNGAVTLKGNATPVKKVILRWEAPLPENCRFLSDAWERGYGDLEWRGFNAERIMPWYFFAKSGESMALFGVKTGPDALCYFTCDTKGITLICDVRCGADGVSLLGKEIICARVVFCEKKTQHPYKTACELTGLMAEAPVLPHSPVYGYNNWYFAYGHSCEKDILDAALELSELTKGLKIRPFNIIDDGWQKLRNDYIGGPWREGNAKFPDMRSLADAMLSIDISPGIWFRPLQNIDKNIPENFFRDAVDGILDVSVPGVLEIIKEDVRTFVNWGYRLIKHDYSTRDISGRWGSGMGNDFCGRDIHLQNRDKTTAMLIKELYKTIYTAAQGKALILGCNCVGHLGVGYMELNRTGDDTSGIDWARTRKMGVNTLAFRGLQHNSFYSADADCVGITDSIPWEKNRQWLRLLSASATPLFISVRPGTLSDEKKEDVKAALMSASRPQNTIIPLDWENNVCPEKWMINGAVEEFNWY